MPVYVYECVNCEEETEVVMGMYDKPDQDDDGNYDLSDLDVKCENCGGTKFRKKISAHSSSPNNWSKWQGPNVKAPLGKKR